MFQLSFRRTSPSTTFTSPNTSLTSSSPYTHPMPTPLPSSQEEEPLLKEEKSEPRRPHIAAYPLVHL